MQCNDISVSPYSAYQQLPYLKINILSKINSGSLTIMLYVIILSIVALEN